MFELTLYGTTQLFSEKKLSNFFYNHLEIINVEFREIVNEVIITMLTPMPEEMLDIMIKGDMITGFMYRRVTKA